VKIISLAREKKVTMFIMIFYITSKKFYEIQKSRQNFLKVIQLKKIISSLKREYFGIYKDECPTLRPFFFIG